MKHVYIPVNRPTLDKRSVKSLNTVASERAAALESRAMLRHANTKTAQLERERFARQLIRAIENPGKIEHAVVLGQAQRKAARLAAGKWWQEGINA